MNTKLLLQRLLTAGCLALAIGLFEATIGGGRPMLFSPAGWWRGAIACWILIVAIRAVYPAQAK